MLFDITNIKVRYVQETTGWLVMMIVENPDVIFLPSGLVKKENVLHVACETVSKRQQF